MMQLPTQWKEFAMIAETKTGTIDSVVLANYILKHYGPMSHLKLQKLLFYCDAYCLAFFGRELVADKFEAWVHGPVSPALYDKFKCFSFSSIKLAGDYTPRIASDDIELIESVWETYGDHTGNALEALTHSEPPWIEARAGYAPNERCNVPISLESMKRYYASIYLGGDA